MSVCPVCGCKTDELDFVDAKLGGNDVRVCSFCEKQLHALSGDAPTAAQLHWLDAVLAKDVPERSPEIANALRAERARFPSLEPVAPAAPAPAVPAGFPAPAAPRPSGYAAPAAPDAPANAALLQRVEALENELKALKRKMLIQKIVELGVPVVLLLLIIIIFFASGLFDKLQQFFRLVNMDFFG